MLTFLQTGDWDFAWNLQVEPQILAQMQEGGQGAVYGSPPVSVERILINFSDPNTEVDGERSSLQAPHPFLTDIEVRRALSLATDRETISSQRGLRTRKALRLRATEMGHLLCMSWTPTGGA